MNKDLLWRVLEIIIISAAIIAVVCIAVNFIKHSSQEIIHQKGVVVGQDHDIWYIETTRYESWKVKVKTDDGNIFTENSRRVYKNTYIGQEVDVNKVETYYKDKLISVHYEVVLD